VLLLRLVMRHTWAAVAFSVVIIVAMNVLGSDNPLADGAVATVLLGVVMAALLRYGLLTLIALIFVVNLLQTVPLTMSMSSWYWPATMIPPLVVLALATGAFAVSLDKRTLFDAD